MPSVSEEHDIEGTPMVRPSRTESTFSVGGTAIGGYEGFRTSAPDPRYSLGGTAVGAYAPPPSFGSYHQGSSAFSQGGTAHGAYEGFVTPNTSRDEEIEHGTRYEQMLLREPGESPPEASNGVFGARAAALHSHRCPRWAPVAASMLVSCFFLRLAFSVLFS